MGISERKERDKLGMKKMILDAAMKLFIEEGYESVSIRKIADKIEYSPASIYTYFPDKNSILFELHTEGFAKLYEKQLEVQKFSDPAEKLIAHGKAYLDFAIGNPEYYDVMFIMHSPACKIMECKIWEAGDKSYDLLLKNVEECKTAGLLKDYDANAIAFLLWSAVHGISALYLRNRLVTAELHPTHFNNMIENSLQILKSIIK